MGLKDYWAVAARHPRFLAFGFLMTFVSSAGQTYFIGVFGPAIRDEFGLGHTEWGAFYLGGTLLSALLLTWTGAKIDTLPLRRYASLVTIGLVIACLVMAATPGPVFLIVSIFLLRQTGQGLSSHTGLTAVARQFRTGRGKALAMTLFGFAAGQAALPVLAVQGIAAFGWRWTYCLVAAALVATALPLIRVLLAHHADDHLRPPDANDPPETVASVTRRQVLSDWRFYLLLPATLAPSFIDTAMFFHHPALADAKGWSLTWITGSYWAYSLGAICAAVASGPVIDSITARRTMPVVLLPLTLSMAVIMTVDSAPWALLYLVLIGVTGGLINTAATALWAEIYGTRHLGAIKAMITALQVFSTALGPVTLGAMIDAGMPFERIALILGLYCVGASAVLAAGLRAYRPALAISP